MTAALEDQSDYMKDRMPLFIAGVVGLSFLLLLVAFHSPLISLKAAIMNLLSVSAAYGVMTLVAKGGALGQLIGIDHEVPVAPFMPVMMFAILFGLSMDYEVFLISRIREEYLKDGDTRRAVADGLAKTARVITAAAAIMVVVFLAFLAAPDVFLKLFGIGLASAIFLDATARADGARAGRDAAARRPQLVDPELARADPAAARRRGWSAPRPRAPLRPNLNPTGVGPKRARAPPIAGLSSSVGVISQGDAPALLTVCAGSDPHASRRNLDTDQRHRAAPAPVLDRGDRLVERARARDPDRALAERRWRPRSAGCSGARRGRGHAQPRRRTARRS